MQSLARLDLTYVWHPFTQMREWLRREPTVIVSGRRALVRDARGREYLDANSSIWTNLHGHRQPTIDAALRRQLGKLAHSSALGLANEPASKLAQRLVELANCQPESRAELPGGSPPLRKVFFSDDGSTAMEVALKLAYEYSRRTRPARKPRFLSLAGAYHGDTLGAAALGHISQFRRRYADLLFKTDEVASPYCYRCPYNRAKPERADARQYRRCGWECLDQLEQRFRRARRRDKPYSAFVFEPLIQGAAGMIPQPEGWLKQAAKIARSNGALLIADEVMTAFGRTGCNAGRAHSKAPARPAPLFACQQEAVSPDFLGLAKGLTGGYLPMAATLVAQPIFDAFLGEYKEFKTFFHGHSYTGNQLGAAAALASLAVLQTPASIVARRKLQQTLHEELRSLWTHPNVGDIRQVGLIVGIELVKEWRTRQPFALEERSGIRVCEAMARRGVLTRPIGNVIVLMPPYCSTPAQARKIVTVLGEAIREELGKRKI